MTDDLGRRVADELEIRNLIGRLVDATDNGTVDEVCACFSDDGQWIFHPPGGGEPIRHQGQAGLRAGVEQRRAAKSSGPPSNGKHVVVVNHIALAGDKASVRSYMSFVADADTAPVIRSQKLYSDELVRTASGWKMARRDIT